MKKILLLLLISTAMYAQPNIQTPPDYALCDIDGSGYAIFNLNVMNNAILGGLNPSQYNVIYFETQANANANVNIIEDASVYTNIVPSIQLIYVRVQSLTSPEYATTQFKLIVNAAPSIGPVQPLIVFDTEAPIEDLQAVVSLTDYIEQQLENLNIEGVTVTFYTTSQDAMDNSNTIADPNIYAVQGESTVYYRLESAEGCYTVASFDIIVLPEDYETPPPTSPTSLTFTEGDTLGDIELEGENIQWYSTDGSENLPPNGLDTTLPLTTLLIEGTTYFATQTVYGIESNDRLPVTVNFNLGLDDIAFAGLQYYPNPTKNTLTILNNNEIESVSILNSLGQTIDNVIVKSNNIEANLTHLSGGIYFVKIVSANRSRTFKIIKE